MTKKKEDWRDLRDLKSFKIFYQDHDRLNQRKELFEILPEAFEFRQFSRTKVSFFTQSLKKKKLT